MIPQNILEELNSSRNLSPNPNLVHQISSLENYRRTPIFQHHQSNSWENLVLHSAPSFSRIAMNQDIASSLSNYVFPEISDTSIGLAPELGEIIGHLF